jgi:hypothetical protein
MDPVATAAIAVKPNMAVTKYSAGPNISETSAKGGAKNKSTKPLIIPPTTDAKVEIRMASIARPLFVIS